MSSEKVSNLPISVEMEQRIAMRQNTVTAGEKKEEPKPVLLRRHFNVHQLYYRQTKNSPIEFDRTFLNHHIADLKTKLMNAYYCFAYQAKQGYDWEIKEDTLNKEFTAVGRSDGITWNLSIGEDRLAMTRTVTNGTRESVDEVAFTTDNPEGNSIHYASSLTDKNKILEKTGRKNDKALMGAHSLVEQLTNFKPRRVQPKKAELKLVYSRPA